MSTFSSTVAELDPIKSGMSRGANKIREFFDKCSANKRKLLANSLVIRLKNYFPFSLVNRKEW